VCADLSAVEKRRVLRLRVFARERRRRAVACSALSKKVVETLLPSCCRAYLAVSRLGTEGEEQSERDAAENARR
jgi:hypothetical protein